MCVVCDTPQVSSQSLKNLLIQAEFSCLEIIIFQSKFLLFNNFFEVKPQLDQNSMSMGDLTRGLIHLGSTAFGTDLFL
jgi:hypothetical protein